MPLLKGCCCFSELERGSRASAIYSLLSAFGQCGAAGYALIRGYQLLNEMPEHQFYNHFPPGAFVYFWIALVAAGLIVLLSFLLWVGIERGYEGRYFILSWLVVFSTFRFIIIGGVIVYLVWLSNAIYDVFYLNNALMIGVVYGIVETFVAIAAILCVISFYQELDDKVNGHKRRTQFALWMFDREMAVQANPSVSGSRRTSHGSNYVIN